jgi:hypothetical protein
MNLKDPSLIFLLRYVKNGCPVIPALMLFPINATHKRIHAVSGNAFQLQGSNGFDIFFILPALAARHQPPGRLFC